MQVPHPGVDNWLSGLETIYQYWDTPGIPTNNTVVKNEKQAALSKFCKALNIFRFIKVKIQTQKHYSEK